MMQSLKTDKMSSKCNSVIKCIWMILSVTSGHPEFNGTSVQTVHRGKSVNISCNYKPSSDIEGFTVKLENNNKLCSVMNRNKSWINQSCKDHIRFIWSPKTRDEMLFEVSNLQINDTGPYKCVVTKTIPPPVEHLGEERTFVQVIAHPSVSVCHVRAWDGFHMILCRSEGFYPSALELVWRRNGGFQNVPLTHNINKTNPDGSFTLRSYLNVSDFTNYSCWVNHSSLSQPVILHLSADSYENRETFRGYLWIAVLITPLTSVLLIIAVMLCPWRSCQQPVEVSVPYELILRPELKTGVLLDSVFSDHHTADNHLHKTDYSTIIFQ